MSFYTEVITRDPRFRSLEEIRDPALLEPNFRAVTEAIIAAARALGHDLRGGETYRSEERQRQLFAEHRTEEREVGVHHFGLARDFLLFDAAGRYDPIGEHYLFLLDLAARHPCPWGPTISGIDWGAPPWQKHAFNDWDHLQGVTVAQQSALYTLAWYPKPPTA